MKVLGHHVVVPAALLAMLDGGLFLAALYALGFAGTCQNCSLLSATHLLFHEALLLAIAFVVISASIGLYNRDSFLQFRIFFQRFLLATQFVFIPSVVVLGIIRAAADAPFGWYLGILTIDIALFFLVLFIVRVILLWGLDLSFLKRRVLIVGNSPEAETAVNFIATHGTSHLRCVGHLRDLFIAKDITVTQGNVVALQAEPAQTLDLAEVALSVRAEEIVIAVDERRGLPMWQLLECKLQGVAVTDYLVFWERETGKIDLDAVGPGWLAMSDGFKLDWSRRALKRALDIGVSLAFLLLALPVGLLVALLIRLEGRGPIFYKQERVGRDGKVFWIWKFRSMRVDAENDGVPRWASQGDDRVTRVGRIIRNLRLDEFPQVFNVLKGDMSFIGPRPERPFFVEQLRKQVSLYELRHRVRPGITGWAQVNHPYGASHEDAKRKLAYDLYYVKNQDAILDVVILLQTVRVLLFSHGSR
ncbi:MAG: TIGR03013 family XrtA/PEP-CTERM system glycosyltransferase [Alphaproteobacteria bacterium]